MSLTDPLPLNAAPSPRSTTPPTSQIDLTVPVYGSPTTLSVRNNFATAAAEITALMAQTVGAPFLSLAGGQMTGPMSLYGDPTSPLMPATKQYVDAGGSGGGGGIPEAPTDAPHFYGRNQGAWVPVVPLAGNAAAPMTGELILSGDPTHALGAVTKEYADAIDAIATGAVPLAGGTMTGLLILSGDPSNVLGATTKQYVDAADNLRSPIANPTFTGTVTTGSRLVVAGPSGPAIALYDTTASRPVFGMWNSGGLFSIGMAVAGSGNPTGTPFLTMDQTGAFALSSSAKLNVTSGRLISSLNGNSPLIAINNTSQGNIFGLWNNGNLQIGTTDANGVPGTALINIDASGDVTMAGASNRTLLVQGPIDVEGTAGSFNMIDRVNTSNAWGLYSSSNTLNVSYNAGASALTLAASGQATIPGALIVGNGGQVTSLPFAVNAVSGTAAQISAVSGSALNLRMDNAGPILYLLYQTSTYVGGISITSTGSTFNNSSDGRLKEHASPIDPIFVGAVMDALEPIIFDWIGAAPDVRTDYGFIAQDVHRVFPRAVTPGVGDPGNEDFRPWMLDNSKLVPLLVAEIKALRSRVASLEEKRW